MSLHTEFDRAKDDATVIVVKARDEGRELTAEENQQFESAMKRAADLKDRMAQAKRDHEKLSLVDQLGDVGMKTDDEHPVRSPGRGKTVGEKFVAAPEWKSWLRQWPNGMIPESAKGVNSPPISFPGLKALITGADATSGGGFVGNDFRGFPDPGTFQRPLVMRDVVTVGNTTSDTVEYVRQTGFTNNAAPVAEATATAGTSGVKPESALAFVTVTEPVRNIAHWIPATKRILADAGQIRTIIDNFLRYGLDEELEDQMINGNGTGQNFTGLANVAGTQAQAWDTNILVTTRRARTKVRTVGRATPTAYLLNPADWETVALTRDDSGAAAGTGGFMFGSPAAMSAPTLWGLPVVESEAVPAGVGYVGDFRTLVLWDREQATVQVSDSHADFFIRNMVAFLAEVRAAFGALRPSAIVEMDLTAL